MRRRGRTGELGVFGARRREVVLDLGDERAGLLLPSDDTSDGARQLVPGNAVVDVAGGLRDRGRDLRQRRVVVLGEARVQREDDVGPERGDALVVDRAGFADDFGRRATEHGELVLSPRPRGRRVTAEPLGHADRDDAQREHGIVIGQPDGHDPFRRSIDRRRAVLVLDGAWKGRCARHAGGGGAAAFVRAVVAAGRDGGGAQQRERDSGNGRSYGPQRRASSSS